MAFMLYGFCLAAGWGGLAGGIKKTTVRSSPDSSLGSLLLVALCVVRWEF